jgi:hypothetical protein
MNKAGFCKVVLHDEEREIFMELMTESKLWYSSKIMSTRSTLAIFDPKDAEYVKNIMSLFGR